MIFAFGSQKLHTSGWNPPSNRAERTTRRRTESTRSAAAHLAAQRPIGRSSRSGAQDERLQRESPAAETARVDPHAAAATYQRKGAPRASTIESEHPVTAQPQTSANPRKRPHSAEERMTPRPA